MGSMPRDLQDDRRLRRYLLGELPDTHGWLTFVYEDEAHLRDRVATTARAR